MANPTIGATTPRIQYTATASQTVFTVPFEFLANADLAVYVNGTLKTLTTDYTLTGANTTGGGTLTFVTGRTAGDIVTILGNLAYSRDTNKYTKYGLLPAEVLEADFDAMQVQAKQLARDGQFALRAPLTDTGSPSMTLPVVATRASKALGFDASGNPTVSASSLADIDTATQIVNTIGAAPAGSAANVSYTPAGIGAVSTNVQTKLRETVSVKDFGAIGDGDAAKATANTAAINAAILAVSSAGGGHVYVPSGTYITNDNIELLDNVYLFGDGYASHLRNISSSGFSKCVVISGNVGDITGGNGLFAETEYSIQAVTAGDFDVDLVTAGNASNFNVGDIVGIASYESWPNAFPENFEKILNLNEVVSISGGTITLRYYIPDTYPSSSGNPTIRKVSGSFDGYGSKPMWAAKNCGASNLRITQSTGIGSGWYALFPCGVNQIFENIWMDDASTLIGSNMLSHSILRNINGRFEAGALDFADWQNNNLLENMHLTRFAANALLNKIGISIHDGTDIIARNIKISLDGYGAISLYKVFRGVYEDVQVIDPGDDYGILLGYGTDCEVKRGTVINPVKYGIGIVGERHRVSECRIPSAPVGYYSVYAPSTINVCYVHDNEFGTEGSITSRDRFFQQTAQSENAFINNNTGYIEHELKKGLINDPNFASTNSTSYAVIKTTTLKGSSGIVRGFRIYAAGARSGTASTKVVRLQLGANTIGQVSYAAPDTATWSIEAVINVSTGNNVRVDYKAYLGTTLQQHAQTTLASALTSDATITVEGIVANAADFMAVYQFIVEAF